MYFQFPIIQYLCLLLLSRLGFRILQIIQATLAASSCCPARFFCPWGWWWINQTRISGWGFMGSIYIFFFQCHVTNKGQLGVHWELRKVL